MNDINALSYEQAYRDLNDLVAQLESGDLPLDESVRLYERGRLLAAHCQKLLDAAELRIQRLNDDGGLSAF